MKREQEIREPGNGIRYFLTTILSLLRIATTFFALTFSVLHYVSTVCCITVQMKI